MGVDKMGTTILFTEEKMKEVILRQNEKFIKSLPKEKREEINNIRKKIKRMGKCKKKI